MILPSDETPGKPGGDEPEDDFSWAQGAGPEELPLPFPDPYGPGGGVQHPAPPGWREDLKRSVLEALKELAVIEDPAEEFDPPEPPDLFMFYGELSALRNEMRRGQKKLADSIKAGASPADASAANELVALYDEIVTAGKAPDAAPLIEASLLRAGIILIPAKAGQAFDAAVMVSASGKPPAKTAKVKAVKRAGFTWNGQLLRPVIVEM